MVDYKFEATTQKSISDPEPVFLRVLNLLRSLKEKLLKGEKIFGALMTAFTNWPEENEYFPLFFNLVKFFIELDTIIDDTKVKDSSSNSLEQMIANCKAHEIDLSRDRKNFEKLQNAFVFFVQQSVSKILNTYQNKLSKEILELIRTTSYDVAKGLYSDLLVGLGLTEESDRRDSFIKLADDYPSAIVGLGVLGSIISNASLLEVDNLEKFRKFIRVSNRLTRVLDDVVSSPKGDLRNLIYYVDINREVFLRDGVDSDALIKFIEKEVQEAEKAINEIGFDRFLPGEINALRSIGFYYLSYLDLWLNQKSHPLLPELMERFHSSALIKETLAKIKTSSNRTVVTS